MRREKYTFDRRTFLRAGSIGAAAAACSLDTRAAPTATQNPGQTTGPVYRTLGRTGLKVAVIGIGSNQAQDPALFQYAFDRGVNYIDTARVYKNGLSERNVGKAIKGMRDKVIVATKLKPGTKEAMRRSIEASLQALQTDYVDVMLAHGLSSARHVLNEDTREVLAAAKKQGTVRFVGFSSHQNMVECIDTASTDPDKFFDVVMVRFNFKNTPDVNEAVARAARTGIGMVAMKTQVKARRGTDPGGYQTQEFGPINPHQAALKWVLNDPHISTTVPSMVNTDQIKENVEVMGMKLSMVDKQILSRYDAFITPYYCAGCGKCRSTCPARVDIPEVNRCMMYAEGYGALDLAREAYAELDGDSSVGACAECPTCVAECPNGIDIARNTRVAHAMLA